MLRRQALTGAAADKQTSSENETVEESNKCIAVEASVQSQCDYQIVLRSSSISTFPVKMAAMRLFTGRGC